MTRASRPALRFLVGALLVFAALAVAADPSWAARKTLKKSADYVQQEGGSMLDWALGTDRPAPAQLEKELAKLARTVDRELLANMKKIDPKTKSIAGFTKRHPERFSRTTSFLDMEKKVGRAKVQSISEAHKLYSYPRTIDKAGTVKAERPKALHGLGKTGGAYDPARNMTVVSDKIKDAQLHPSLAHELTHKSNAQLFIKMHGAGPASPADYPIAALEEGFASYAGQWQRMKNGMLSPAESIAFLQEFRPLLKIARAEQRYLAGNKGMTQEKLVTMMMDEFKLPRKTALEIVAAPGYTSAYGYGLSRMMKWEKYGRHKLGKLFDVRGFNTKIQRTMLQTKAQNMATVEKAVIGYVNRRYGQRAAINRALERTPTNLKREQPGSSASRRVLPLAHPGSRVAASRR